MNYFIVNLNTQRTAMNHKFFAVALLISAMAAKANVTLDVAARYGNDTTEQKIEFKRPGQSWTLEHDSGVRALISLEEEGPQAAKLHVKLVEGEGKAERILADELINATYSESVTRTCTADDVRAELTVIANHAAPSANVMS
jgi:hypothetical protein